MPHTEPELGHAHGAHAIGEGIRRRERVVYTTNGNRILTPDKVLRWLEPISPRCGITRVADISRLTFEEFPVFQSCRPGIWGHPSHGQNTGSQGKGATRDQAKVSCIMESIEGYCSEPRQVRLYRASYAQLRPHRVVVDPRRFVQHRGEPRVRVTEPLMWADAWSVELDQPVLVPAEAVFYPFVAGDFATRSLFPAWTNGLASGSTLLEAITHGLNEVLERYVLALYERNRADAFVVSPSNEQLVSPRARAFLRKTSDALDTSIFLLKVPRRRQEVTVAICQLLHRYTMAGAEGSGCSSLPDVAIERAVSEAAQSLTVAASGAREDLARSRYVRPARRRHPRHAPSYYPSSHRFADLRNELRFLVKEVRGMGFPDVFIANLTRVGIEVPVVRVLVPEMEVPLEIAERRAEPPKIPGWVTHRRFAVGVNDRASR